MNAEQQHSLAWEERLQDWLDGSRDSAAFQAHLHSCSICQRQRALLEQLDQALQQAMPRIALDETFDAKVLARATELDKNRRAAARRKVEQELEAQLTALSQSWRRTLALVIPGIIAGVAIMPVLGTWIDDTGLARMLMLESAGTLNGDMIELARPLAGALSGAALGLGLARWLATLIE